MVIKRGFYSSERQLYRRFAMLRPPGESPEQRGKSAFSLPGIAIPGCVFTKSSYTCFGNRDQLVVQLVPVTA